jgi:HKD family nuclease
MNNTSNLIMRFTFIISIMIRILTRDDDIPSILIKEVHNLFKTRDFEVDIATAFVNSNGLMIIKDPLTNSDKSYLVTSNITKKAYNWLVNHRIEPRLYDDLHAKLYIMHNNNAYIALIGSSNLTKRGLTVNFEVDVMLKGEVTDSYYEQLLKIFNTIWNASRPITQNDLALLQSINKNVKVTITRNEIIHIERQALKLLGINRDALIKCKSTDKEDRKQCINTIYNKLRRLTQGNTLPEQAFRTEISKNAHIEKLGKLCHEAPSEWFLGIPCIMIYIAYELGRSGKTYDTGISFYEDILEKSLNQTRKIKGVKNDVINFITQELDRVRNDKEYREQVIERKIGATILPLILALPRNCNITGIFKRNRYERKITC